MRKLLVYSAMLLVPVVFCIPALAHHSFAMFDYNKEVTVNGEVSEFKWANPHIHIYVKAPDGKVAPEDARAARLGAPGPA